MKIAYCTNVRLPSERAHGHQVAAVCEALAVLGHEVTIFAPYRDNPVTESFQNYYGLQHPITLKHLGSIDYIAAWWTPGVLGLKRMTSVFGGQLRKQLRSENYDLIYTRTPELLPYFAGFQNVILELHKIPRMMGFAKMANRCALIVALTSPMKKVLEEMGVTAPIVVEGDAVDLEQFKKLPTKAAMREFFNVSTSMPLIVYTGQLQSMGLSKGIPELLDALEILKKNDISFYAIIAGGPSAVRDRFIETLNSEMQSNILLPGHIDHIQIPSILAAADVLVYPAPKSNHPFYNRDTSPLKLFEYMAAGRPIVAADLPPLHDAVDSSMVTFVEPGSGKALAEGIEWVLKNPEKAQEKAKKARSHVERFTWEKRMKRILEAATISS